MGDKKETSRKGWGPWSKRGSEEWILANSARSGSKPASAMAVAPIGGERTALAAANIGYTTVPC